MLADRSINSNYSDTFDLIRSKIMRKQQERNDKQNNLTSRQVSYEVGQEIFRINFSQSNFEKAYNA